jgi:ABC-type multidrug transport system ATPase subunit
MIELRDLYLRLDNRPVLQGFSLTAKSGRLSLLAGANGAGKSSSLKVACGLWRPGSGVVIADGLNLTNRRQSAFRTVAYLPQSPAFNPRLKTTDILEFYADLEGRDRRHADLALERFGLEAHARHRTGTLSGGLRQRLGLAVLSLATAPVLLLDEPGLSLDPPWRSRLQSWLREEAASGRTILVATHLLGEWEGRADACFLCEHGRVVGQLDPDALRGACFVSLEGCAGKDADEVCDDNLNTRISHG